METLKSQLVKSPLQRTAYNCLVYGSNLLKTEEVDCKSRGVVYRAKCMGFGKDSKPCQSFYVGETLRSVGERFKEHVERYEARASRSVFWLDCKDEHDGDPQKLEVGIACKRSSDAMLRQISEAVLIENDDLDLKNDVNGGIGMSPGERKKEITT